MRLNQIMVPALDLEASRAFYERLGFRLIVLEPDYCRFLAPEGETTLSLHLETEASRGPGVVVFLESDDVDATYARLSAAGIVFEHPPQDQPWLWREATFTDPAGNRLCLYHAGENRLAPPWSVSEAPK